MPFGVTTERIEEWLAAAHGERAIALHGLAASPGLAEGRARVIVQPEQLEDLQDGEILVAASTSPS
jgi:pyruvate,water dikinase